MEITVPVKRLVEYNIVRRDTEGSNGKERLALSITPRRPAWLRSLMLDSGKLNRRLELSAAFTALLIMFWFIGVPAMFSEGPRTCQAGTRCFEIWTAAIAAPAAGIAAAIFFGCIMVARNLEFMNALRLATLLKGMKPKRDGMQPVEEAYLQVLACKKHGYTPNRRDIPTWNNPSAANKAVQRLVAAGWLNSDQSYRDVRFKVQGDVDVETKQKLETFLEDQWDMLMAYEYYMVVRRGKC